MCTWSACWLTSFRSHWDGTAWSRWRLKLCWWLDKCSYASYNHRRWGRWSVTWKKMQTAIETQRNSVGSRRWTPPTCRRQSWNEYYSFARPPATNLLASTFGVHSPMLGIIAPLDVFVAAGRMSIPALGRKTQKYMEQLVMEMKNWARQYDGFHLKSSIISSIA